MKVPLAPGSRAHTFSMPDWSAMLPGGCMGTADYCALVVLLLAGLITLSIRQDDKRQADRRQQGGPPPTGRERRTGRDRRDRSFPAYLAWAARSQWLKLRALFHG